MPPQQPPRVPKWLLEHLVSGRHREALIGDLDEQLVNGRSSLWYWRQVASAILTDTVGSIRDDKVSTVRSVLVTWSLLVPWYYVTVATYQRTARSVERWIPGTYWQGSVLQRLAWWAWWIYDAPLLIVWFGASLVIGWVIARLQPRATPLASVVSLLPWTALWAWPAWHNAHAHGIYTRYTIPNEIYAVLVLVGIPLCTLIGGLLAARGDQLRRQQSAS